MPPLWWKGNYTITKAHKVQKTNPKVQRESKVEWLNTWILWDNKAEVARLLAIIEKRKRDYRICDVTVEKIPQQKQLFQDLIDRLLIPVQERPICYLYYGWNWAGKTFIGAYITVLLALWKQCEKYHLPYIGEKKLIWIGTKSWSNVKAVIDTYLMGEGSWCRIPPDEIERKTYDNQILKAIVLKNWCKIQVYTYDQGYENWQGWNPDFIWMDEEPTDWEIFSEAKARLRNIGTEMMITMTPLSWLTPVYYYFLDQQDEELQQKIKTYSVNSMDNPFTDKTWTKGMTEEEYRMRVEGSFSNPTWLVYNEFKLKTHVVNHFDPSELGDEVEYYRSIDFGTSHPTWVIFLAKDNNGNLYVYDEIYWSNILLQDLVSEINRKSLNREIVYTLWDSAAKRERFELGKLWIRCQAADKHSKWENEMSNRRAWILTINNLLHNNKLFISDRCKNLIKEFQLHFYKQDSKDWEVIKTNDDLLDALRYLIFNLKRVSWETIKEKEYRQKYWKPYKLDMGMVKKNPFVNF